MWKNVKVCIFAYSALARNVVEYRSPFSKIHSMHNMKEHLIFFNYSTVHVHSFLVEYSVWKPNTQLLYKIFLAIQFNTRINNINTVCTGKSSTERVKLVNKLLLWLCRCLNVLQNFFIQLYRNCNNFSVID